MAKQFLTAPELAALVGVSKSKSYELIKKMNMELSDRGFLTVRGKVPAAYVQERFFGLKPEANETR